MSCEVCRRAPCPCQSYSHQQNCNHHYSDVADDEEEPLAPNLSLGNRILWLTETSAASGIVRWIGRIPSLSNDWSAGIEFDNEMPGGGSGRFQGRIFFNSRPGHALFLPVLEVIKVDDPSVIGERTSFFGRIQDSCSNFAHRRRRDSTFGHFKQECFASCAQNISQSNSRYYKHAPVYDRISSRRSRLYDDHPYESYVPIPCVSVQPRNKMQERNDLQQNHRVSELSYTRQRSSDEQSNKNLTYTQYSDNQIGQTRKESIFYPRSTLRLINGFKEWVSNFMLGTTRPKHTGKLILKDRKSVTSVFVSNGPQSITGQRLSSFSEYTSVSLNSSPSKSSNTRVKLVGQDPKSLPTSEKRKSRKKRPAPLPPVQQLNHFIRNKVTDNEERGSVNAQRNKFEAQSTSNIVQTSSLVRKKHKKRRAPPPPTLYSAAKSSIYASVLKEGNQDGITWKNYDNLHFLPAKPRSNSSTQSQDWNRIDDRKKKHKHKALCRQLRRIPKNLDCTQQSLVHTDSGDLGSSSSSISISSDESEDETFRSVKYKLANSIDSVDRGSSVSRASNFVQYATDNSDVCLKISIQKTETNVVTLEEVPSSRTVRYIIDENTSSSELSDEPPVIPVKTRAIKSLSDSKPTVELKDNNSASIDEKSQTIFDELQMQPPVKGSVKDFVHAFNLLANKGTRANFMSNNDNINEESTTQQKINKRSPSKNLQSVPTNWEFQNNNGLFQTNQALLPIAEESINETSEYDGGISYEEKGAVSKREKKHQHSLFKKPLGHSHKTEGYQEAKKKCSHCFEKHVLSFNQKNNSSLIGNQKKHEKLAFSVCSGDQQNTDSSPRASITALSSLLQAKSQDVERENAASCSKSSTNSKLNQPIMVGLHIEDKSSHKGPIPLLVTPSMTLKKLKKQVENEHDFPSHQQCWILGESFAVQDDATLASYGVLEAGCSILLYVMTKESKSCSLPCRKPAGHCSLQSIPFVEESSDEELKVHRKRSHRRHKSNQKKEVRGFGHQEDTLKILAKSETGVNSKKIKKEFLHKSQETEKTKSVMHKTWEEESEKKADYHTLLALDDVDLVTNHEKFECPVCFMDVDCGAGAVLQDCLHSFCRECLASSVQYSDTAIIKCPFANDEYSCESHLQEREIKCLVSPDIYERHLQRSMALAESQAQDSFHCKTPDCRGWCLFEDNVNIFLCPVCKHTNCLTCAAVHEGRNCKQYQDFLAFNCDTSEEVKKTKEYLQNMVQNGEAMECPQCQVILMKKWGCDWLKCSMCHTEVCWVTKGPRWGPAGRGDTSGGCKCMLDGVRCHPKCSYCH